jgi:hypothetical protein
MMDDTPPKQKKSRRSAIYARELNFRDICRDVVIKVPTVTRVEVIDEREGRAYVRSGVVVELSYQDHGRTLKVFVNGS